MNTLARHDNNFAWRVGELNTAVSEVLQGTFREPIWVQGELGRFSSNNASGHFYCSLRDEEKNEVSFVFFRGAGIVRDMKLAEGDKVMVCGMVDLFRPGGRFQLRVRQIAACHETGELMRRFQEIRDRLELEGLLSEDRKRPLPAFPRRLGLLTSVNQGSAAFHDFLATLENRMPGLNVRMINVPVQGNGAAENIASWLRYLDQYGECDIIVISRGGGSKEDLWEFNSETLARTAAACRTPIVSAIGHQIDKTILDLVADVSCITPTDAAVRITDTAFRQRQALEGLQQRLFYCQNHRLQLARARLDRAASSYCLTHPANLYVQQQQRLGYAEDRLAGAFTRMLTERRSRLAALEAAIPAHWQKRFMRDKSRLEVAAGTLNALNPKQVLKRGYSIILDDRGSALRRPEDTATGSEVTALLAEGSIRLTVK
ncbi:MAG: exodeoxyribonuclease VII large subunit [Victivallales bacterium]|nr:exodeoxyribonuclease VII large subunit [Victivallales bacterium]